MAIVDCQQQITDTRIFKKLLQWRLNTQWMPDEVMGMRNGQLVIFKKGCKPTVVEPKITKVKSQIKTLR